MWAAPRFPGITLGELEAGRAAYTRRCGGCHVLRLPEEFTPESWTLLLDKMETRQDVALLPGERVRIGRFLAVMSARVRRRE